MKKLWKWVAAAVGTIFLGALSTPVWENILNPLFKVLLLISTLGLEKFKDNIYLDIARGLHEDTSLLLLMLGVGILTGFILSLCLAILKFQSEEKDSFIHKFFRTQHKIMSSKIFLSFYVLLMLTMTVLMLTQVRYVNNAITYYNQLLMISTPYISVQEHELLQSKFAQIKNRQDYINIVNELKQIVVKYNQQTPQPISFIF